MTTEIQGVRLDEGERAAPALPRDIRTDELVFNMGPQHPSTHGVLRVILRTAVPAFALHTDASRLLGWPSPER